MKPGKGSEMRKKREWSVEAGFRDRDSALAHFIMTGSPRKIDAYLRRYGIEKARDGRIHRAALYRMAQQCSELPYAVKHAALELGIALGFPPEAFRTEGSVWRSE